MDKRKKRAGVGKGGPGKGVGVDIYLHHVTDAENACLTDPANARRLQEVRTQSGADVQLDSKPSTVHGMKTVIIKGDQTQIENAVRLLQQMTGSQEDVLKRAQEFWLKWVEAAFPDLEYRAYFLPPVYFNRVPMTNQSIAGQEIQVLHKPSEQTGQSCQVVGNPAAVVQGSIPQPPLVQGCAVRDDAAMQHVLLCLQEMSQRHIEVLFAMSQLQFGQYLGEPCYAAAAAHLSLPASIPPSLPKNWKKGDFDVLLIHRDYGFVVLEVKAVGDNVSELGLSQQDIDNNIRKRLKKAITQLDKAEAMLSHLVSDIASGLRITKTIAVPNLTTHQVQQAIFGDKQLTQDLGRCLGKMYKTDPPGVAGLFLCSDQLSDPKTPCDVSSHVLRELGDWWQRRVAGSGPDSHMTPGVYKTLVARFCGPATTVTLPCTSLPRLSVKTLGQAVWCTGECYTAVITLFPEQLHLLHTQPPTLFVTGPPGTGKTVVLLLMAIQWLRCGHHVYVVSVCDKSRAASTMLYHLLLQTVKTQQSAGVSPGQPHLLQVGHSDEKIEKAVNDLSQAAIGGSLYVVADEAMTGYSNNLKTLCDKLLTRVPRLHLWAADCFSRNLPAGWHVEHLTRPLRSPSVVVREVKQDSLIISSGQVLPYSERGVSDHTDGPPVRRMYHGGQGHSGDSPVDCVTCGREVASFLRSLRVGVTGKEIWTSTAMTSSRGGTAPAYLQWRDVLVLYSSEISKKSGILKGLREAGIPVRVMKDDDIEDVATARSDVVWVADTGRVRGLERKVVVCVQNVVSFRHWDDGSESWSQKKISLRSQTEISSDRFHLMSRCTSQLVIVARDNQPPEHKRHSLICHLL